MGLSSSTEVNEIALERLRLEHRLKVGANWFSWIAALSFINSVIALVGQQQFGFVLGLGTTQIIDAIVPTLNTDSFIGKVMALTIDTVFAGLFLFFAQRAKEAYRWAFVLGMILYGLDALIFLWGKDYLGIVFHAFALFGLAGGLQALSQLESFSQETSSSHDNVEVIHTSIQ